MGCCRLGMGICNNLHELVTNYHEVVIDVLVVFSFRDIISTQVYVMINDSREKTGCGSLTMGRLL